MIYRFIYKLKDDKERSYRIVGNRPLAYYIDDFERNFPEREYFRVRKEV